REGQGAGGRGAQPARAGAFWAGVVKVGAPTTRPAPADVPAEITSGPAEGRRHHRRGCHYSPRDRQVGSGRGAGCDQTGNGWNETEEKLFHWCPQCDNQGITNGSIFREEAV